MYHFYCSEAGPFIVNRHKTMPLVLAYFPFQVPAFQGANYPIVSAGLPHIAADIPFHVT